MLYQVEQICMLLSIALWLGCLMRMRVSPSLLATSPRTTQRHHRRHLLDVSNLAGSFNATDEERYALQLAVEHWCGCSPDDSAHVTCPAHKILGDAELIKHLLFVRSKLVGEMMAGEFGGELPI